MLRPITETLLSNTLLMNILNTLQIMTFILLVLSNASVSNKFKILVTLKPMIQSTLLTLVKLLQSVELILM